MKKFAFALIAGLAVISSGFAGTAVVSTGKSFKQPVIDQVTPCFADNEFTIDLFGGYQAVNDGDLYDDGFGFGVGVNYFFARNFGLGLSGFWGELADGGDTWLHSVYADAIIRFPIDSVCLSPYILGGAGVLMDGYNRWVGHAGAGLEYRVTEKVGIFSDARWVFDRANDFVLVRTGVRFAF